MGEIFFMFFLIFTTKASEATTLSGWKTIQTCEAKNSLLYKHMEILSCFPLSQSL